MRHNPSGLRSEEQSLLCELLLGAKLRQFALQPRERRVGRRRIPACSLQKRFVQHELQPPPFAVRHTASGRVQRVAEAFDQRAHDVRTTGLSPCFLLGIVFDRRVVHLLKKITRRAVFSPDGMERPVLGRTRFQPRTARVVPSTKSRKSCWAPPRKRTERSGPFPRALNQVASYTDLGHGDGRSPADVDCTIHIFNCIVR
jgi:hypothetical protein